MVHAGQQLKYSSLLCLPYLTELLTITYDLNTLQGYTSSCNVTDDEQDRLVSVPCLLIMLTISCAISLLHTTIDQDSIREEGHCLEQQWN